MNWMTTLFSRVAGPVASLSSTPEAAGADQTRRGWLKRIGLALGGGIVAGPALASAAAAAPSAPGATFRTAGADPFLGEIMLFAGNFAPRGFAFCEGQIISIAQNSALFSLLGTTYGGNGVTTFALPDLRGRAPIHQGQGPGLSSIPLGDVGGQEQVTMLATQMPQHTHALGVNSGAGTSASPSGGVLASGAGTNVHGETIPVMGYAAGPNAAAAANAIGTAGGSQPLPIRSPYLALNYCIALQGIFPSRS